MKSVYGIYEVDKPNITLLRLVVCNPDWFYPQDWYYDQEFANTPIPTRLAFGVYLAPTAAQCAYIYTKAVRESYDLWSLKYYWTSDVDDSGNRIYVGGWNLGRRKGLQIHRHLTNPNVVDF